MNPTPGDRLLPCGTDPETLLEYAAEATSPGPGTHAAGCSYCQSTISEYRRLWAPFQAWATRNIDSPAHFVDTVMKRVRRIVQSPRHAATVSEQGITSVTSWVLGLIASAATLDTPHVSGITGTPVYADKEAVYRYGTDGVEITETGAADITVTLGLTASNPSSLPALADQVRRNIIHAIKDTTRIDATEVDIGIDDIQHDGLTPR